MKNKALLLSLLCIGMNILESYIVPLQRKMEKWNADFSFKVAQNVAKRYWWKILLKNEMNNEDMFILRLK